MEKRVAELERQMRELTAKHAQLQGILDGITLNNAMTSEMYDVFKYAKAGLQFFGAIYKILAWLGRKVFQVIQALAYIAKPIVWIIAFLIACGTYVSTGHFEWPKW